MRDRLARKGFDPDTVDDVMSRLDRAQLLDDEDFAAEWVRSRHTYSGRGRLALRHELQAKGVAAQTIENALDDIDTEDERASAAALVARKLTPNAVRSAAGDRAERDKLCRRLIGMLARRGFAQPMAIDVVTAAVDDALATAQETSAE
ncbi:hypothetical protein GCM10009624_09780 [Gordonia sinesedis]